MLHASRFSNELMKHVATILAAALVSLTAVWLGGHPGPVDPTPDVQPLPHDPEIVGPASPVEMGRLARFVLPDEVLDTTGHWRVVARSTVVPDAALVECDGGRTAFVETFAPCVYDVSVAGLRDGRVFHWATTFEVGGSPTPAPPPIPPGPDPKPIDVAPVNVAGFRALLVYESEQGLPAPFAASSVREYLNTRCVKGEDGRTPDWRCWDQHVDPQADFAVWQSYWKVPRSGLPWVVVGNGRSGFSGPMPATADELLDLLKKHGG
jgi:hypothetical protein